MAAPIAEAWELMQDLMLTVHRPRWLAAAAELELTPAQVLTLRRLDPTRPLPMNELARSLACDASNVTGITDRLEARGLVERRGAAHDRRVKMVALTDEGAALRGELVRRMSEPPPQLAALPAGDQRALRDIMRRLRG